jgi:CRISPR-associated protein Csm1
MFECIANKSKGKKMLGYFKADVDNLGAVFAFGLKETNTVSRVSTLSRMLDVFFSGYVQTIIRKDYPDLYTVYSGGDDLLVIGPWNTIIDFSEHLNSRFREFTCNNSNLTLSAGIALVKHNYPVFRSVDIADNALDKSKREEKNRLTVFGQTIGWDDLPEVMAESRKLEIWIGQKQVSSGFAMNLLTYSEMSHNYNLTGETKYLRFLPLMTYDIARNLPYVNSPDLEKRNIRLWAEEQKDLQNDRSKHLGIIANYALIANRGGKNE